MISVFKRTNIYLILSLAFILLSTACLFITEKVSFHLFINNSHSNFQDIFFKWITHLGDGVFLTISSIVLVALFWKKYSYSILSFAGLNLLLVAGIVQTLKRIIYFDAYRPMKFIGSDLLYLVPGVEIHAENSFPSGHTAAAFAFFAFFTLLFGVKKWIQLACVVTAILVGYSRIYLSQHFLEDAVAGASIGISCFIVTYLIIRMIPFKFNIAN